MTIPALKSFKRKLRTLTLQWLRPGANKEELMEMLSHAEAIQSDEQRRMFEDVIEFRETRVREIMVPRSDIKAIDINDDLATAEAALLKYHVNKLVVMEDDLDHIHGSIYIWDILNAHQNPEHSNISDLVKPCVKVSELERVPGLLNKMKVDSHIAIVLDEFGGTSGLITLSDLLEEIVGDIGGGESNQQECIRTDYGWDVMARIHTEDLAEQLNLELPQGDYDTFAGLITTELGRIPVRGERLLVAGMDIHIKEADPRKIIRVLIKSTNHDLSSETDCE